MKNIDFKITAQPFSSTHHLSHIISGFDAQTVIIGERHDDKGLHKTIFLENIPALKEQGFSRVFLEGPLDLNDLVRQMKNGASVKFNSPSGQRDPLVKSLYAQSMDISFIDFDTAVRERNGEDKIFSKTFYLRSKKIHEAHTIKDMAIIDVNKERKMSKDSYLEFVHDVDIATCCGRQTLNNLIDYWELDKKHSSTKALQAALPAAQKKLLDAEKSRINGMKSIDVKRNKFMSERIAQSLKPSQRALVLVGAAHIESAITSMPANTTIQAILNNKYDISTVSVNLCGAGECIFSKEKAWDTIIVKDEINPEVTSAYNYTRPEIQACGNRLAFSNFYVDNYELNDLNSPDIDIHFAQKQNTYRLA
jgi:hypothetical protein